MLRERRVGNVAVTWAIYSNWRALHQRIPPPAVPPFPLSDSLPLWPSGSLDRFDRFDRFDSFNRFGRWQSRNNIFGIWRVAVTIFFLEWQLRYIFLSRSQNIFSGVSYTNIFSSGSYKKKVLKWQLQTFSGVAVKKDIFLEWQLQKNIFLKWQ